MTLCTVIYSKKRKFAPLGTTSFFLEKKSMNMASKSFLINKQDASVFLYVKMVKMKQYFAETCEQILWVPSALY